MVSSSGSSLRCDSTNASSAGSDVVFKNDGLELGRVGELLHALANLLRRHAQPFGDSRNILVDVLELIAQEQRGKRGIVVDKSAAFAVENLSTGRKDRYRADAVTLGQRFKAVAAGDLQTRQPEAQYQEDRQDRILDGGDFELRNFFAAT